MQATYDGINGATLPCIWLVHATSGDSVTKQPHKFIFPALRAE